MELLFYKLCFKLLKTFKLFHKTVYSRDCGASEQKEGKYRRKKDRKKERSGVQFKMKTKLSTVIGFTTKHAVHCNACNTKLEGYNLLKTKQGPNTKPLQTMGATINNEFYNDRTTGGL